MINAFQVRWNQLTERNPSLYSEADKRIAMLGYVWGKSEALKMMVKQVEETRGTPPGEKI